MGDRENDAPRRSRRRRPRWRRRLRSVGAAFRPVSVRRIRRAFTPRKAGQPRRRPGELWPWIVGAGLGVLVCLVILVGVLAPSPKSGTPTLTVAQGGGPPVETTAATPAPEAAATSPTTLPAPVRAVDVPTSRAAVAAPTTRPAQAVTSPTRTPRRQMALSAQTPPPPAPPATQPARPEPAGFAEPASSTAGGLVASPSDETSPDQPVKSPWESQPPPSPTPQDPATSPAPTASEDAPAGGCTPLTNGGKCYEPGEFCRKSDRGTHGVAGDGKEIVCVDNDGLRWEPA